MRLLFTTTGHLGHTRPLAPVVDAALSAGHDVVVAGPATRRPALEALGADVRTFPGPTDAQTAAAMASISDLSARGAQAIVVRDLFGLTLGAIALDGLREIAEHIAPDAIVRETYELAGAAVASALDVPLAVLALGTMDLQRQDARHAASAVAELAGRLGAARGRAAAAHAQALYLSALPAALESPGARDRSAVTRFRDAAQRKPAAQAPWPAGDGPRVYASFGTVAGNLPGAAGLYGPAVAALGRLDARVLVSTGNPLIEELIADVPPNVRVEPWVDEDAALPAADAVIGHGGQGTMLAALRHGLPQVVIPLFSHDQWHNADRVTAVGAGLALTGAPRRGPEPPGPDVIDQLPSAVNDVLTTPRMRSVAQGIAAEIAALPAADVAVAALERVAARGRGPMRVA
ncbi:MAG TPA: glycosyltransferase [Capillimicrobium sp.]|jgi:UDP:flavonoid glycosyltransferase YjiC (YdhE family)